MTPSGRNIARRGRSSRLRGLFLGGLALVGGCENAVDDGDVVHDLLAGPPFRETVETRRIDFGHGDRRNLGRGWSAVNERDVKTGDRFIWATAHEATLRLHVLGALRLQGLLDLWSFPVHEPLRVEVSLNGTRIAAFEAEEGYREYRLVLPAEHLEKGLNELTLRHSRLISGPPGDERRFAARYVSLLLGPDCLPLRGTGSPVQPVVEHRPSGEIDVTGPAELRFRSAIPRGGRLLLAGELPEEADDVAVVHLDVRDHDAWVELGTLRVAPPLLGGTASARIVVDLSPFAGPARLLRVRIGPEPCGSSVARILVRRLAILGDPGTAS